MRRAAATLIALVVMSTAADGVAAASKSHTPVTSSIKKLKMSTEELRIRVRALIRPTLGTIEESADRIISETADELETVVDHAFVRAIELLLIGAALAFAGMVVYARWLR